MRLQDGSEGGVEPSGDVDGIGLSKQEEEDLHAKLDKIVSKRLKLKRALTPSDEPHPSKRHRTLAEEGKSADPQLLSEPVGEFTSSSSPRTSH